LDEKIKALEKRIIEQDYRLAKMEESLLHGNDKFRNIDQVLEVMLRSVFAILEFEVHYCEEEKKPISKNLERAKDDLHDYLAKHL
jgi:predicted  nucleic acid-binding Zn-ribbon protein